jgi:hypothetical protein
MTPPSQRRRPTVRWARALADDIDPVVVDRLVAGQPVPSYTSYERREAVRRLHTSGLSNAAIAARLGVHDGQVHRDFTALGIPPAWSRTAVLAAAARRRPVVACLAAAGARRGEIARLLRCTPWVIDKDLIAIGRRCSDIRPLPCRPLAELQRLYGHLLTDSQAGAA